MFTPATQIDQFFHDGYVPERLAGPAHAVTRLKYQTQLAKLSQFFRLRLTAHGESPRPMLLSDLSDEILKLAMHHHLERGNSVATVNGLYAHVKAIWNLAWAKDLVPRQCRTQKYRQVRREPRCWLADQVTEIVRAAFLMPGMVGSVAASDWWPALILLSLNNGTRVTPTMRIEWRDVDLDHGELLVRGETQKQRADQAFDLLPGAHAVLSRLRFESDCATPRVFGDWPYDADGSWRALRRHYRRLLVLAGLFERPADVRREHLFHRLRRCVATEIAARAGIDAARIYLGHSSTAVTERYIDKRRLARPKAADVLTDPLPPGQQLRLWGETG